MNTVRKLLGTKEEEASKYSVTAQDTVLTALKAMAEANIGAVFIVDGKRIAGIYTERDYLRKGELEGRQAASTLVKDVMTRNVYTVTMDTSLEDCIALMGVHHIRHLPVLENDQLVGLVSIRDVMKAALENKEGALQSIEEYIMGSGFVS
jgi:CBS domain-containing protein